MSIRDAMASTPCESRPQKGNTVPDMLMGVKYEILLLLLYKNDWQIFPRILDNNEKSRENTQERNRTLMKVLFLLIDAVYILFCF